MVYPIANFCSQKGTIIIHALGAPYHLSYCNDNLPETRLGQCYLGSARDICSSVDLDPEACQIYQDYTSVLFSDLICQGKPK